MMSECGWQVVHHIGKGISKRTMRMPLSSFLARFPRACLCGAKLARYKPWGVLCASLLSCKFVRRHYAFMLRRDIPSHVCISFSIGPRTRGVLKPLTEALHREKFCP